MQQIAGKPDDTMARGRHPVNRVVCIDVLRMLCVRDVELNLKLKRVGVVVLTSVAGVYM